MAEKLAGLDPMRTVPQGGAATLGADRAGPGCCAGMRWVMAGTQGWEWLSLQMHRQGTCL